MPPDIKEQIPQSVRDVIWPYVLYMNGNLTIPRYQAALDYYLEAMKSYHELMEDEKLQNQQQAIDFVKNLEIPLNLKIAECYFELSQFLDTIKFCNCIIDTNLGISDEGELGDIRASSYHLRAQALLILKHSDLAKKDLEESLILRNDEQVESLLNSI